MFSMDSIFYIDILLIIFKLKEKSLFEMKLLPLIILLMAGSFTSEIQPQDRDEKGWYKLLDYKGLDVAFLFYKEADNVNNGVVIKLNNKTSIKLIMNSAAYSS